MDFFFFKQKTADEMRISDWSSDVCSSDLLSPAISHKAIERRADQRFEDHIDVTPRQRQVLELIGRGKSTKEIASLMGISVKTVETHRARLMQSLGLYGTNALKIGRAHV